jgi:hypothetical protein
MLSTLAGHESGLGTSDLVATLGVSPDDLAIEARQLLEDGLIEVAVASLSSGWWKVTPRGASYVSASDG